MEKKFKNCKDEVFLILDEYVSEGKLVLKYEAYCNCGELLFVTDKPNEKEKYYCNICDNELDKDDLVHKNIYYIKKQG